MLQAAQNVPSIHIYLHLEVSTAHNANLVKIGFMDLYLKLEVGSVDVPPIHITTEFHAMHAPPAMQTQPPPPLVLMDQLLILSHAHARLDLLEMG
jgi:hypothetical protein